MHDFGYFKLVQFMQFLGLQVGIRRISTCFPFRAGDDFNGLVLKNRDFIKITLVGRSSNRDGIK